MSHAFDAKALELSRQAIALFFEPMPGVQLQAKIQNLFIDAMKFAAPAEQAEQEPVRLAYRLPFDQWLSQQTGTIDVDCGCVTTEAFFHWMRTAYDAGNYPGWIPVSDRLPEAAITVLISNGADIGKAYWLDEWGYDFAGDKVPGDVTHWMPMPNPPQQEAECCAASGAAHKYKLERIPSEFISGVEGGPTTEVMQCEYCGKTDNNYHEGTP